VKIPKSFTLMGHTIKVHIVSLRDWEALAEQYDEMDDCCGFWVPDSNLIVLLRQPKSKLMHTYLHEVTHAVLFYMNNKLWRNEQFVDQFAGLLSQALETGTNGDKAAK
jgi:hypothetical protein